jgi:hypothetical protein
MLRFTSDALEKEFIDRDVECIPVYLMLILTKFRSEENGLVLRHVVDQEYSRVGAFHHLYRCPVD